MSSRRYSSKVPSCLWEEGTGLLDSRSGRRGRGCSTVGVGGGGGGLLDSRSGRRGGAAGQSRGNVVGVAAGQ